MIDVKPLDLSKCMPKTIAQLKMMDNGVDALTALQLTNNKDKIAPITKYKLEQKYKKYSLLSPAMRKLAHNAIKDCLTDTPIKQVIKKIGKDGQEIEITEEMAPTWSNKIAAASMVYDRVEPVIHKAESVSHHVIHPVDLSKYRNDELSTGSQNAEVIDISAT